MSRSVHSSNKFVYAALMALVVVFGFIKLFYLAKVLGVIHFAPYILFISLEAYLIPMLTGGLTEAVFRQYPILLGRGELNDAYRLRNRIFLLIAMIMLIECCIAALSSLILYQVGQVVWAYWVVVSAVHIIGTTLFFLVLREVRSRLKSVEYALCMCVRLILDLFVLFFLVSQTDVYSFLLLEACILILVGVVALVRVPSLRMVGVNSDVKGIFKVGIGMFGASSIGTFATMGDRVLLGVWLPVQQYSTYVFNGIVFQAGLSLASIVHQYIQPLVMQKFGSDGCIDSVYGEMLIWFRRLLLVAIVACPFIWILYGYAMAIYYPEYSFGLLLFLSFYFSAILHTGNVFGLLLIATNQLRVLFLSQILVAAFLCVAMGLGLSFSFDLAYFAIAFFISRLLSLCFSFTLARRQLKSNNINLSN